MDPTANLKEQREISERILSDEYEALIAATRDGERLAELVEALDQWISKGGALPTQWVRR